MKEEEPTSRLEAAQTLGEVVCGKPWPADTLVYFDGDVTILQLPLPLDEEPVREEGEKECTASR